MRRKFTADPTLSTRITKWWDEHPFTYFVEGEEGSWEYFRNIDRKFLKWVPYAQTGYPFLTSYIDMYGLRGKAVLDIACGTGLLTEQFVRMGADVTAIDIAPKAVELTKRRLALEHLDAKVLVADAQHLPFPDESFDLVCAWGCLMHMPDTEKAIHEIWRVLRPGGTMLAMMYHKNSVHLRYAIQFYKGIIRLQYLTYDNQSLVNRHTDGFLVGGNELAKFYSRREFQGLFKNFRNVVIRIDDHPSMPEKLPHPLLPLGKLLPNFLKQKICQCFGMTAIIQGAKP